MRPDSPEQHWNLRVANKISPAFSDRLVYHHKDGSVRESETITTTATAIAVDDPFGGALDIEFIPNFEPASVNMVFIDVEYHDDDHAYHRVKRL